MNSTRLIVGSFCLALLFSFGACDAAPETKAPEVQTTALAKPVASLDTFWIDVRTPQEYADGHLPGAYNIPLQDFTQLFESMILNKEATIALYCRSGNRSGQALSLAQRMGYTNAFNAGAYSNLKQTR